MNWLNFVIATLMREGHHRVSAEVAAVIVAGITERFGKDIFARLEQEGAVSVPHPNNDGPDWILTDEVLVDCVVMKTDVC